MDNEVVKELQSIDWTFSDANTQYSVHGISKYPARMIPQIPDKLLEIFKRHNVISEKDTLYDPFAGSGTSLVSAKMNNLYGIGNDINPFAVYLSQVKTTCLTPSAIESCHYDIKHNILPDLDSAEAKNCVDENINSGWFPKPQESQLLYIRHRLNELEYSEEIIKPFKIVLSTVARECSYQRNGEYKRYRIPEEQRETHNPNVKELFTSYSDEVSAQLIQFSKQYSETPPSVVHLQDSRETTINDNSVDIIGSSPPYGDHSTTVAYGQFSRDPSIIAFGKDKTEMLDVDKKGLGGKYAFESNKDLRKHSEALDKTMRSLEEVDGRSEDALAFFSDFTYVLKDAYRVIKPGQPVCWVVANRTMSRTTIPTNIIIQEVAEHIGFTTELVLPREIPSKTLPWENAPENIEGETDKLMADENILIFSK